MKLNHYTRKTGSGPLSYAVKGQMTTRPQAHAGKAKLSRPVGIFPKKSYSRKG